MKSGFVELVIRNALAGRKVQKVENVPRYQPVDSFKKYIKQVLPKIQQSIQVQLLKKNLDKISNSLVRKQLINAYIHRLFRLKIHEKDEARNYKQPTSHSSRLKFIPRNPTIIKKLDQVTTSDIGYYIVFPSEDMEKVFKSGCFGEYHQKQFGTTKKFGVMIREESVTITEVMKKIQNPIQFSWAQLKQLSSAKLSDFVNNEHNYPTLFSNVSNMIYAKTYQYRKRQDYLRIWGSSVISDALTNSILNQLPKLINHLESVIDQSIQYIMKLEKVPSPADFTQRFKQLPTNPVLPISNNVPYNTQFYWKTPSMKNVFLGGKQGVGKSMIMTYAVMWAYQNGWIIINCPSGFKWTQDNKLQSMERSYNGLFMIYDHAVLWLEQFISVNEQVLKSIQVDQNLYGKSDIAGVREDQYEPVPNVYDERRKTYSHEISLKVQGRMQDADYTKQKNMRMNDVLQKPQNILQIAKAGIKNKKYSICAMSEVLSQVYRLDKPILQCVDGFTQFYRPSFYPSFRYFNDRGLYGKIPPYHLAHCRMFMHLDGHKLKNGLKIVTSSHYPLYKHQFDITKIMFPKQYQHHVRNLNATQFSNAGQFGKISGWWPVHKVLVEDTGYAYTLTQGNWGDFQQLLNNDYYF